MIRAYLATMFAVVLLDVFDKLVARYGLKPKRWETFPSTGLVFGVMEDSWQGGVRRDMRFLFIPIPFVRTWGVLDPYRYPINKEYGFRSHRLRWIESDNPDFGGWRIDPPLPE